jgi:hypothetical protein
MMPVEGDNKARSATSAGIGDAVGLGLGFKRGELVDLSGREVIVVESESGIGAGVSSGCN